MVPAITRPNDPFNVLLNPIFAPFEVIVLPPVKLTGLENVRVFAPVTVILFATWIRLALVNTKFVKGATPPTIPPNKTAPPVPASRVKELAPLIVLEKEILAPASVPPPFVVSNVGVPVIATAPVSPTAPPLVVIFPLILMALVPV